MTGKPAARANRPPRRGRPKSGFSLMLTILALLGFILLVLATAMLADAISRVGDRGAQKSAANELAEAGLNSFYDTIRTTMVSNNGSAYPNAPGGTTTLTTTMNGRARTMGTYTAQYVGTPTSTSTTSGSTTTTTWKFTIMGVGTSQGGGTVSKVQGTFTGTIITSSGSSGGGSFTGGAGLGPGAIQSATTVIFKTDGGFRTIDSSASNATGSNVIANAGLGWVPYSQARANANPNVLQIDGDFETLASPSSAYSYTTSASTGLYKAAGSQVFVSDTNGIVGMSSAASFPSATQTSAWQSNWITQSQSTSNTYSGTVTASSLTPNPTNPGQGEHRITAPAYINGNLNVDSGQMYLQPNSNTTKSNVVYVTGNVTNGALLYNRGVDLIVQGQYIETSSSAQYQLQTQYSPYSSMTALYGAAALVSLQASTTAINMYTSASTAEGLVYAANGGMTVNGNNEIDGVLIAGGTGSAGGVTLIPANGNSFVVKYHNEAVLGRTDFNLSGSTTTTVTQAFTPTRFYPWVQVQ